MLVEDMHNVLKKEMQDYDYRPEDSPKPLNHEYVNARQNVVNDPALDIGKDAAQRLAQNDYDKLDQMEANHPGWSGNRDIGVQSKANDLKHQHGGTLTDTSKTVASTLVQRGHEDAIKQVAESKKPPLLQQFNSQTGGSGSVPSPVKSDRMSKYVTESPNPPPSRLSELFTQTQNPKGF